MSDDPYGEATAEFYDLLATGAWESFGPSLKELLADVDPSAGPIVDLGAGTGVGTVHIHRAVPDARIWAVEPSKAMRTALHARLAADAELRALVTVVPFAFEHAAMPERISGLVASAVLGHFEGPARAALWELLEHRLAPGAPAVIEVLPPTRPEPVPPTCYRRLEVGDHVYEGWMEGAPVDDRRMRWTMTYRMLDGRMPDGRMPDHVVYERAASATWFCAGPDDVEAEIRPYRLVMERPDDECVIVRRR